MATVADHVTPHHGDMDLFYDINNLQSLCDTCHGIKTATEDGGFGTLKGSLYYPYGLPKPIIPLTVVSGAPCSGKTSYIAQHKGEHDCVIDVDYIIAELSGLDLYKADHNKWMNAAMIERNKRVAGLSIPSIYERAWLISSSAYRWQREYWRERYGAKVVLIATNAAECVRRGNADERRGQSEIDREARRVSIDNWWSRYQPLDTDVVV